MRVCAERYPYFFQYRYLSMKRDYDAYKNTANNTAISKFNKTVEEMKKSDSLTEEEAVFLDKYKNNCPMDESPGVQNRICWAVEKEFDEFKTYKPQGISCLSILNYANINDNLHKEVRFLCEMCKDDIKKQAKNFIKHNISDGDASRTTSEIIKYYTSEMYKICPNEDELCDILIDLCYNFGFNKEILWVSCGDVIANRLLDKNNGTIRYAKCIDGTLDEPNFICCGKKYVMRIIKDGEQYEV